MVYPGHPSRGCLQCIKRRVKCDEEKPACKRCIKRGEECPGYRRSKFRFVPADAESATSSLEQKPPRASHRTSESITSSPPSESSSTSARSHSSSLSGRWPEECIPWFFHHYLIPQTSSVQPGWLHIVPQLYAETWEQLALSLSLQAAASAGLANHTHNTSLASQAQEMYGSALIALNVALQDNIVAREDGTLAAALMLVMYEAITCSESQEQSHIDGLLAIVKLRGVDQFNTARGYLLFQQVQLLLTRILIPTGDERQSRIAHDVQILFLQSLRATGRDASADGQCAALTCRISDLFSDAVDHIRDEAGGAMNSTAEALIHRATVVDTELDHYYNQHASPSTSEIRYASAATSAAAHHDILQSVARSIQYATKITLHELRLRLVTSVNLKSGLHMQGASVGRTYDTLVWTSVGIIPGLAEQIRSSVIECLGDPVLGNGDEYQPMPTGTMAAAYLLLWPLLVVKLATCSTKEQRSFADNTLRQIGERLGIQQATEFHKSRRKGLIDT